MELETVYTAYREPDAEIVRLALEAVGISCVIDNPRQGGLTGVLPAKLRVKSEDAERAREVIRNHEQAAADESETEGTDDSD